VEQFIGCDAHKKFSVFVAVDEKGQASKPVRVEHERESYRAFLRQLPAGSQIALGVCGFWYRMVDGKVTCPPGLAATNFDAAGRVTRAGDRDVSLGHERLEPLRRRRAGDFGAGRKRHGYGQRLRPDRADSEPDSG